jgi:ATP-binding cassette, subfamily B, bacterial MsbA
MKNLKKFLKYIKPHKKYLIGSLIFNVFYGLFSAISMLTLIPMLTVLFDDSKKIKVKPNLKEFDGVIPFLENNMNYFISNNLENKGAMNTLLWMVALVLSAFLLKNLFSYLAIVFMTILNNNILNDLRNDVYQKVISLNTSFFSGERKGDLMARMTTDINTIKTSFMSVIMLVGREPFTVVFTLVSMVLISWKLTLFVFIFIPVSGLLISKLSKSIKSQSGNIFALEGELLSSIEETLGGISIIKNFTAENFFNKRFKIFTKNINVINNSLGIKMALAGPTSEFLGILVISVLLVFGGVLVLVDKSLTGSLFITYIGLSYQILTPAKQMAKANYALQGGNAASERVQFILEAENPLKDISNASVIQEFNNEIKFNNISFKYDNEYVLKDFSLTLPKGKTVALVGESGSGKSTLAKLITRFYDVNEGTITFDGVNIKNVTTKSLRQQMGIVAQDSILFNDSISNNISLGIENTNENSIIHAAKIANAHNYISEFPEGYNTNVGDGGSSLSGGQRQRVAIARAVMKNPPIMILDEATSALDTESEKVVQDALENMMENKTSLVIAHRLSTVKNADLIVVMKKGRIVEQGTHQELLSFDGTYTNLVKLQSLEVSNI